MKIALKWLGYAALLAAVGVATSAAIAWLRQYEELRPVAGSGAVEAHAADPSKELTE